MIDEGYIKFNLSWEEAPPLDRKILDELIDYRNRCYQQGFIGVYPDSGIGYGNISIRYNKHQFIISGTQTGSIPVTTAEHFTLVTKVDFAQNLVECKGPRKASAESLTHAIFYDLDENINAVIHIHNNQIWTNLKNKILTTNEQVPYGTLEMTAEVKRLYRSTNLPEEKLLVMGGHQDGLISFGKDLEEAFAKLLSIPQQ